MNYIPLIALGLSGIALIISALSFWFSRRAQHHTQIVSFEQRKQEIRRILLEEQVLHGEIKSECVFRSNPATDSGPIPATDSGETGHRSGAFQPPLMVA
jgi:hypothetical protein